MKNFAFILVWLIVGTVSAELIWRDHPIMGFVLVICLLGATSIKAGK